MNLMLLCEECDMWRLLCSPHKLSNHERQKLEDLSDYSFIITCGFTLSALSLDGTDVCSQDLKCNDPVENLYYAMKYDPICIDCCGDENLGQQDLC